MFQVIRLNHGPKKGQVWIVPLRKREGYIIRNGREWSGPRLKADCLVSGITYTEALWYSRGLLRGETKRLSSPFVLPGRSKVWRAVQ